MTDPLLASGEPSSSLPQEVSLPVAAAPPECDGDGSPEAETTPPLYLIAHKVRGQLAFDVAHQLQIGSEIGWVIPTSGHRAYPYWSHPLADFTFYDDAIGGLSSPFEPAATVLPPDWRDHYHIEDRKPTQLQRRILSPKLSIGDLL